MSSPDFWNDRDESEKIINRKNSLKKVVDSINEVKVKVKANTEMLELLKLEPNEDMLNLISEEADEISKTIEELNLNLLLNGPYDALGAIMEIHAGAGGTEACDWADMLLRMYTRFSEKSGFKYEIVDKQVLDEAGFKSATILIKGDYAYGKLKSEKGVHRLIRISPFDSNA